MKKLFTVLSVALMLVCSFVPVFAEDDIMPVMDQDSVILCLNKHWKENDRYLTYPYAVVTTRGTKTVLVMSKGMPYANENNLVFPGGYYQGNMVHYTGGLTSAGSGDNTLTVPLVDIDEYVWTSNDILGPSGTLFAHDDSFFPIPLWETIAMALVGARMKITGTMATLALCGIGCLALLVGLMLLVKTFRTVS